MFFPCRGRQRRGPYVTRACTNCQEKHVRCTGGAACKRCTQRNLVCTFNVSSKKRGPRPKKKSKDPKQAYVLNNTKKDLYGTFMLSSVILNPIQGRTLNLLSTSEYSQRQSDNINESYFDSYEEPNILAFQEVSPYQTCTGYAK
ncbi:45960_t:CDS:1 [Gigaspora margarita]|uniref:45960_t:CDS:1 n=1 Tax=Gigaspora margarita TaxID=4874 RepID=A0ABN7UAA3_GIGMA|nr:45960_t:CDS:1 [Gigaspora margarita]